MYIKKLIVSSIIIAVIINLVLPQIVKPFATSKQIAPPNGANNLKFFDQIIYMLYHHAHVPLTSSIIVAVIVGLSVCLGTML